MPLINYLTQIQFEAGAIRLAQGECDRLAMARPLIVTDKGVRAAGLLERLTAQLTNGAALPVYDETPGNPTEGAVRAAAVLYKQESCDGLIALGEIATRGMRCGEITASLRPSCMMRTAPRPTSLPVPAVVGTAISGATWAPILDAPPSIAA